MKDQGAVFRQSVTDFPMMVKLGDKVPSWGLTRWKNKGLRFIPLDEENFSLRGDKQRLVYKGHRRSHRFTILGDTAFEYDCILEREPESNVISLLMEGAEHFDFFRQPDFVKEPFLKGSYAVYKKETLLGEGTGKLCHIHRPEIIDARGRRCWGDLSVVGNELRIAIPEKWLSEAAYPVIVDPTVGTTTVGSQYIVEDDGIEATKLCCEVDLPVNRFLVGEQIKGSCTASFYVNEDDYEAGGRPVIYSENYNQPHLKKSSQESFINLRVTKSNPKGWRNGTFTVNDTIQAGSYIWFGMFSEYIWYPRFDYGGYFRDVWTDEYTSIPNIYPNYKAVAYPLVANGYKLSMYFTYISAQNYVRTITQGVKLTDSRKLKVDYKRNATQTANVNSACSRFEGFYRNCAMTVYNNMNVGRFPEFIRRITEDIRLTMAKSENCSLTRICADSANAFTEDKTFLSICREIRDGLKGTDTHSVSVLIMRCVPDNVAVTQHTRHWGAYIRDLLVTVGNIAVASHKAEYCRFYADTVQVEGKANRGLMVFIRIIAKALVQNYVIWRFLKAKSELVLKSCVVREIVLDSRLN
jgi:hypothetical protein